MIMEQDRQRADEKLNLVYSRMFDRVKLASKDMTEFKKHNELEHKVKEAIIERQASQLNQMFSELKAVKAMLEIPRFRE